MFLQLVLHKFGGKKTLKQQVPNGHMALSNAKRY